MQVKPDAAGTVRIWVNATPSGGGMISGIQVWPGSAPVGAPNVNILAPADGTIVARGATVTLKSSAVESGATITKVEYFANGVKVGEATAAPYLLNVINPDTGHYQVIARATDNIGTVGSDTIQIAVLPLNALLNPGQGLSQGADGLSLGDTVSGAGPHKFLVDRYQYLNKKTYSFGGSRTDVVNHPVFRLYDNGDITAGTTADTSYNTNDQQGLRYISKLGILEIGASDRLDTTQNAIVYGNWPSSGLIINTDEHNNLHGKMLNTVVCSDELTTDTATRMEDLFVGVERAHIFSSAKSITRGFLGGYGHNISAALSDCNIVGQGQTISKPMCCNIVAGFVNTQQDSSYSSLLAGTYNKYGGVNQLVSGQYLVNRTPHGTTLGNANVDFTTLPYTGSRATTVAGISGYPLFVVGNGSANDGSIHSNAVTVLYNGRTQINTAGFTTALTQTDVTPKAALDVVSTNTGVLLPRLTNTQRNAIVAGDLQNGLLLYNTDSSAFQYYNGSAWNSVGSGQSTWQFNNGTVFDAGDNIAIGTNDSRGYKLAVNGTALFTKIKVLAAADWPDYVFRRGYVRPSLAELERYIRKNRHLPGIASEKEVRGQGIDVAEGQAALLKKVEELTLYLIDENKDITEQNRQLKEQAKQLEKQQKEIEDLKALIMTKIK